MRSLTLFLGLNQENTTTPKLLKKIWELQYDVFNNPFILNTVNSYHLHYPHTGDFHRYEFLMASENYHIEFRSLRTISSGIIIWGEVTEIVRNENHPTGDEIFDIFDSLTGHDWREANVEEHQSFMRIKNSY